MDGSLWRWFSSIVSFVECSTLNWERRFMMRIIKATVDSGLCLANTKIQAYKSLPVFALSLSLNRSTCCVWLNTNPENFHQIVLSMVDGTGFTGTSLYLIRIDDGDDFLHIKRKQSQLMDYKENTIRRACLFCISAVIIYDDARYILSIQQRQKELLSVSEKDLQSNAWNVHGVCIVWTNIFTIHTHPFTGCRI